MRRICTFPECNRPHKGHGLCSAHLLQRRSGKPLVRIRYLRPAGSAPIIRFISTPGPLATPCHIFQGAKTSRGYGKIWDGQRLTLAHVYVYRTEVRDPNGLDVCHKCDTPSCVNAGHLFAATHDENMADMVSKGRQSRGGSKLAKSDIPNIRRQAAIGVAHRLLALQYGVCRTAITRIVNRTRWTDIP